MHVTQKRFCFWHFLEKKRFINKKILLSFWKHFRFANVFSIKTFSFQKNYFRFGNTFTFVSETLRKPNRKTLHQFFRRGPCVPPSVEGQCFHLRRLDLQIVLRRCLAPVARDRIARTSELDDWFWQTLRVCLSGENITVGPGPGSTIPKLFARLC